MDQRAPGTSPVLHYLAVVRAARDFGLAREEVDRLAVGFRPAPDAVEAFAQAVADTLLARD
jgi:hypothetical protein